MSCFEADEETFAKKAGEMIDFMNSPEGKKKIVEIAKSLPDVAKVDYISLMSK